jgi:hypothetical protein
MFTSVGSSSLNPPKRLQLLITWHGVTFLKTWIFLKTAVGVRNVAKSCTYLYAANAFLTPGSIFIPNCTASRYNLTIRSTENLKWVSCLQVSYYSLACVNPSRGDTHDHYTRTQLAKLHSSCSTGNARNTTVLRICLMPVGDDKVNYFRFGAQFPFIELHSELSYYLDSSVGIVTRLRALRPRTHGSIPGRGKRYLCSAKPTDQHWDQTSLLFKHFPWGLNWPHTSK